MVVTNQVTLEMMQEQPYLDLLGLDRTIEAIIEEYQEHKLS